MARSFNGTTDVINATTIPIFTTFTSFTLAGWVYLVTNAADQYINLLGTGSGSNGAQILALSVASNKASADLRNNGQTDNVAQSSITMGSANTWYHMAGIFNFNTTSSTINTLTAYLNGGGKLSAGPYTSIPMSGNSGVAFATLDLAGGPYGFFPGRIADCAIWNIALSDAEILALALGARPYMIRPASLLGYWPLDGLQSPEPDLSGARSNGTLTGTTLAAGPPVLMFTPRWPQTTQVGAGPPPPSGAVFRRTLSGLGTRTGSRQVQGTF